ncbi:DUF1648 domain-containing protein [Anaerocellum diazotrophicum]|uniref:Membrane protein n=1 Tax=Caldicellulosiruptor diazotrophicus TaxID=2806205 RepID=A0ABM7NPV7_9FIRM|nr:DUF5808 domain-containing protein [Caldicellulosiruptor diazotrophicus]BCS82116.1 membrane protein [Caldicellulosiruptor diazotrophicus]
MSEKLLIFILSFPAQIFLVLLCFFIPYFSREHILFGVNVPPTIKKSKVTQKFYKEYWRNFALTVLIPTLLFFYILFESTERVLIKYNILYPLFVIVLMTLNHYVIYRKVLKAKKKGNWQEGKKQIVVVPIKKDKKGRYPSRLWFLVPIGVFIGLLIITVVRYNQLPKIIPLHYKQKLEVDYSGPKSELIKPLCVMFGSMLLAQGLGYFVYELTKKGKMKLSIYFPEKSAEQNEKVKSYTVYFLIWILVLIELIMGLVIFSMLDIINIQTTLALLPVFLTFPLITLGYYLMKVFNINSERLNLMPEEKISEKIIDRDDDKYWIAGMFYYNPDDPALFVERRVGGFGWDLNYAKPLGKFIGFLIIGILVAVVVVSLVLI